MTFFVLVLLIHSVDKGLGTGQPAYGFPTLAACQAVQEDVRLELLTWAKAQPGVDDASTLCVSIKMLDAVGKPATKISL